VKLISVPGAVTDFGERTLRRFVEVEGAQQATVLAAQAFTSLVPFLVVAAAFGPGDSDLVSALLGALLGAASGIYVPLLLTWSADRYGLIGVAFSLQSWLLAAAFVVVIGAVVGAVASEHLRQRLPKVTCAHPT
jgi:uncharacterized BrkB/YihY/UPF0761 family membrane protein